MSVRKLQFEEGQTYHIYNRGINKSIIFHDREDYLRFQKMLYMCNGTKKFKLKDLVKVDKDAFTFKRGDKLVDILGYALLPNHFHILLVPGFSETKTDANLTNNVSVFMKRLTSAYSQYYNYKYKRTGSLFEGRYKAECVETLEYLKYIFAYIHLNAIKLIQKNWREGIEDYRKVNGFLSEYTYSSFFEYFGVIRKVKGPERIVNTKLFMSKVEDRTELGKEIFDWLEFKTIV